MAKTILICGHGPGISDAVARKFGSEKLTVALVARNAERLSAAAASLGSAGIPAKGFPCDLSDPDAVRAMVKKVRAESGPIAVLHWNAYVFGAGDLLTADVAELRRSVDVSTVGLVAAVQEALPDLEAEKGSVLVTGGGLAFYDPKVDAMACDWQAMGLAVSKAAQHKTTGLLHQALGKKGVYVGEVVVLGAVKGTAFDRGNATLDPNAIASAFWDLHQKREPATVNFS